MQEVGSRLDNPLHNARLLRRNHYAARFVTRADSTFLQPSAVVPPARTAGVPASARYWISIFIAVVAMVAAGSYVVLILTRAQPAVETL